MLNNKSLLTILLGAVVFTACEKKDSVDIKGDVPVKFFTNNETFGNAPANSISYNVVNIPDVAGSGWVNLSATVPANIKFPVFATKPVSQDVTISAELNNSLIAEYNAANNTSYLPFPDGFITNPTGLTANILKDGTRSSDSIAIVTDLTKLSGFTGKAYMAPIKLTSVSAPTAGQISGNTVSSVTYVIANVEQRQIKFNAPAADAIGTLITPRTSWAVTFTPSPTSTSGGGGVIDGSTSSYSRWSASPVQMDVNIQTSRNVTGIRLYTSNSATYTPTQIEVYLSNDGINYDLIGAPLKANLTYASSYNYILFYKPIVAKYVRLKLFYSTSTNTQNFRITEFDVYAN